MPCPAWPKFSCPAPGLHVFGQSPDSCEYLLVLPLRRWGWLMVALAAGFLSGCSALFVKPYSPDYHANERGECTTDYGAPTIDSVLAVATLVGSAVVAEYYNSRAGRVVYIPEFGLTAAFTGSAIHGYRSVAECRHETGAPLSLSPAPNVRPRLVSPGAGGSGSSAAPTLQKADGDEPGVRRPKQEDDPMVGY